MVNKILQYQAPKKQLPNYNISVYFYLIFGLKSDKGNFHLNKANINSAERLAVEQQDFEKCCYIPCTWESNSSAISLPYQTIWTPERPNFMLGLSMHENLPHNCLCPVMSVEQLLFL